MKILIVGSTGEVGKHLLSQATSNTSINKIYTFVRRETEVVDTKTTSMKIDFNEIDSIQALNIDVVFCCLGTTIKKAGSKSAFEKVDYEFVKAVGLYAEKCNAQQIHVISASGANSNSSIFYNQVKGKMEEAIKSLKLVSIYIYRPALLDSERTEKRFGERIAIHFFRIINPLLIGPLKKFASIKVETVANGMLTRSLNSSAGIHIIESDQI